jgi:tetratricopeptide (TPR) repeat protein
MRVVAMNDPARLYEQAIEALNAGRWIEAQQRAAQLAPGAPRHGGVHYIAGVAALGLQQLPLALGHLQRAAHYNPERADYLAQYARALAVAFRMQDALLVADAATRLPCDDAVTWDTLGVIYGRANLHARAAEAFRRAVSLAPGNADFRFNLATSLTFHGHLDAAEEEFEACIAANPRHWRAHLWLAQLRKQAPDRNHVDRLEAIIQTQRHDDDAQLYLNVALAKEYEDLGDYPRAFGHYQTGKAVHRRRLGDADARDAAMFDAIRRHFDGIAGEAAGDGSEEPIFVMGMPRTGTTLVDRILSAHPDVHSAGELNNFGVVVRSMAQRPARTLAGTLEGLDIGGLDWAKMGRDYVESTRPNTGRTPRFTDKLPHNFLYAGFIARALPNARIVCLRRDPMDTCLSNFRQLFALDSPNYDYSYDILDAGRYYLQFDRLMRYWRETMPGRILELEYESLVGAQAACTRGLLEFCGLPWNELCLGFEDNPAPVATASAVQVRSGMNRDSLRRWKRYEAQLAPLRRLLEDAGIHIRD